VLQITHLEARQGKLHLSFLWEFYGIAKVMAYEGADDDCSRRAIEIFTQVQIEYETMRKKE
jgi:hypothetical protein